MAKPKTLCLTKKKLIFEIGEGDSKKVFEVVEPSAAKRDEYLDWLTETSKIYTEKQTVMDKVRKEITEFQGTEHTEDETTAFEVKVKEMMDSYNAIVIPDQREQIEMILGKLDDEFYNNELSSSMKVEIINEYDYELCGMEQILKNLESLLPMISKK